MGESPRDGRPTPASEDAKHEVKGLTFETARKHFTATYGEETWASLMAAIPASTRALFAEATLNEWYPESELRRFILVVYDQLAERDDDRFREIMRGLALAGISRFFRVLIGMASARFVLKKVPVVWGRLRRGPAVLTTEVTADDRVLIHYDGFRYCRDPIYRQLSMANCEALVVAATDKVPRAKIVTWDAFSMTLSFEIPE